MWRPLLRAVFIVTFVASSVAAFAPGAPIVAGCFFAVLGVIWLWCPRWKGDAKALFALGVIAIPLFFVILLPAVRSAQEAGRRSQCNCHLFQIGLALLNYHERNGCLPPAYLCDASGKPTHSWRVLLLPYLEEDNLYRRYNFNEPWNGPNNRLLESSIPRSYTCPTALAAGKNEPPLTSYVVVTGDNTAFPGCRSRQLEEITDRKDETVLVVEVANSDIHWMEPRDPSLDDLVLSHAGDCQPLTSNRVQSDYWWYFQPAGGYVVCADASRHYLPHPISIDYAKAILSVNGGEKLTIDELYSPGPLVAGRRWDHVIGLPAFCLSFIALLVLALTTRRRERQLTPEGSGPTVEAPP